MRDFKWYLTALFVICFVVSAEAQFPPNPKPRPAAGPQATAAPVQAPPVQAAPSEVASPPVVVAAPTTMDEIKSWLNTVFGGLIAMLLAKIGFRPAAPVTSVPGDITPIDRGKSVVIDVLTKLNDPSVRQTFEAHGLQIALTAAQNPLVNTAVQTGLSAVPGLGAAEPIIRSLGIKALQDLVARNEAKAA